MNRLKEFRLRKGLTQDQLGVAVGKYSSWVYELENGYRNPKDLRKEKLSEVLGVTAEELFPQKCPSPFDY